MRAIHSTCSAVLFFALQISLSAADARTEYVERLARVEPRSAQAWTEFARWCKENQLEEQARAAYELAIRIDGDHEGARAALGYKRHGTGWIKSSEPAPPFTRPARKGSRPLPPPPPGGIGANAGSPASQPEVARAPTDAAPAVPPEPVDPPPQEAGEPGQAAPPAATPAPVATPTPEATSVPRPASPSAGARGSEEAATAAIDAKKAWAATAAQKLQTTLSTYEDADFLVHSTLPASSREVKTLVFNLKGHRRNLAAMIGATGSQKIWPEKVQLVLLKSEPEYERFAMQIDNQASAKNPEGAYAVGARLVLHNPDSEAVPRILGTTAFKSLGGSNRWVAWWLEEGVAELLVARSPAGEKRSAYQDAIKSAADYLKAEAETLKIFNLLETASYKSRDAVRNRALALSLCDFLTRKSLRGFQDLIRQLKSEAAPEPPAGGMAAKEEFSAFHLGYISFQEKTLESTFRMSLSALQERWKQYTQQTADSIRAQEAKSNKDDNSKPKKKAKDKGTGQG